MPDTGPEGFADMQPGDAPGMPPGPSPSAQPHPAADAAGECGKLPCGIERVPLFPLQDVVLLPGAVLPLHVFEQRYRAMTADVLSLKCSKTCAGPMDGRKLMCMCRIKPGHDPMDDQPPLFDAACVGKIVHHELLPDGRYNLLLQGLCRVKLGREHPMGEGGCRKPYRRADLHPVACERAFEIDVAEARQKMKALCLRPPIQGTPIGRQLERLFSSSTPTVQLADILAFDLIEDIDERQRLLEEPNERRRVDYLWSLLDRQFPDPESLLSQKPRFDVNQA